LAAIIREQDDPNVAATTVCLAVAAFR